MTDLKPCKFMRQTKNFSDEHDIIRSEKYTTIRNVPVHRQLGFSCVSCILSPIYLLASFIWSEELLHYNLYHVDHVKSLHDIMNTLTIRAPYVSRMINSWCCKDNNRATAVRSTSPAGDYSNEHVQQRQRTAQQKHGSKIIKLMCKSFFSCSHKLFFCSSQRIFIFG